MRFLVVHPGPNFSVQDVYAGWVEGLRELDQHVIEYNLGDRLTFYGSVLMEHDGEVERALSNDSAHEFAVNGLYAALYKTKPDVMLVVSGFFIPPALLALARTYRTRIVLLHTESPYQDDSQLAYARYADLNLINDPTNIDRFRELAPTEYMPHAYRPGLHHPGEPDLKLAADFAFVGTGYPSRVEFFKAMDLSGLDVLLAGNWQLLTEDSPLCQYIAHEVDECLDNEQAAGVYRSANVGLNLYRREADKPELSHGWAMGPREVEMAACGMFFLRDPRPESNTVLSMLPAFDSPGEASEQLRYWLGHEDQRRQLADQARRAVADRTFRNHTAALLRLLDK
jgi:spore maturation protein CgeB